VCDYSKAASEYHLGMATFRLSLQKLNKGYVLRAFASANGPTLSRTFDDWEQVASTLRAAFSLEDRVIKWIQFESMKSSHAVPIFEGMKRIDEDEVQRLGLTPDAIQS
jgi:hypothetical protein